MCGIAGIADSPSEAAVDEQLGLLRHRGPDAWGVFRGNGATIGQTRLAVIDLLTGDPPIANEDGTVGVALNGEIYNFRSLQDRLREAGHTLKTDCDTEVIAHLAETYDPCALARSLDGMFAFAVWDDRKGRLILGRDRFGKKPLYYWHDGKSFVFGSEIKAVVADPRVPRRLADRAVDAYLTFGYVPTPYTFYEGVRSVPPGHVLVRDRDGAVRLERYFAIGAKPRPDGAPVPGSLQDAAEAVRDTLRNAVERRLVADVPVGAFLSGGLDSSAVVGLMSEVSRERVATFTVGFDDNEGFDERPYARIVARHFHTDHTEFVVKPDATTLLEQLVWAHDQPFGDSSALPTYLLSQLTRRHVTVALSGDGGDELFAGYERFAGGVTVARLEALPRPLRRTIEAGLARTPLGGRYTDRARRFLAVSRLGLPRTFLAWVSYVPESWRQELLRDPSPWGYESYDDIWAGSEGASVLTRLLDLNLRTYLLDDLLPKVDRMSMAHGLEVRSPFLDTALVDLAFRLPDGLKLRGFSGKRVLRRAVRDLVPPEILRRPKHGFGLPLDRWFRTDLRSYTEGLLGSKQARLRAHLRPDAIGRLLAAHQDGASLGHALWTLVTLELFLRREDW